ncbi:MAG: DUF1573 domain-containing protein [Planctomycetota bacterium]
MTQQRTKGRRWARTSVGVTVAAVIAALWGATASGPGDAVGPQRESGAATAAEPSWQCSEPVHDFGREWNHKVLRHVFRVTNTGKDVLHLGRPKHSCGCTRARVSPRLLEPGEVARVEVMVSLRNKRGPIKEGVFIQTDSPVAPTIQLTVAGTAVERFRIDPVVLNFGETLIGEGNELEVSVEDLRQRGPFDEVEVRTTNDQFKAQMQGENGDASASIEVRFAPHATEVERGELQVRLLKSDETIAVPLVGRGVGEVDVSPRQIVLLAGADGPSPVTRYLSLRGRSDRPVRIERVIPPSPDVGVELLPKEGNRYLLRLTNLHASPELDGANVRIVTTSERVPNVDVPIRVRHRAEVR